MVQVSAAAFSAKYRSKREVYNFLAVDVGVYLPSYGKCQELGAIVRQAASVHGELLQHTNPFVSPADTVTIYFLKDLTSGVKKKIYGKEVRHITIPAYEGLALRDIATFSDQHPQVDDYLPDGKEVMKMPKQWIANVVHSVLKNIFSDWVKAQVQKRNEELVV